MELMGGLKNRIIGEKGKKERGEEEIEVKEVRNMIRKLKTEKAIGRDKLSNKAWKFGGEEMKNM